MFVMNRKTKCAVIKELIKNASPEELRKIIYAAGFQSNSMNENMEFKRKELLDFLDEMYELWSNNYVDMTDRQNIKEEERSRKIR